MLITLIFSVLFLAGVLILTLSAIFHKLYRKYYHEKVDLITDSEKYKQCKEILYKSSRWEREHNPNNVPDEATINAANEEFKIMDADIDKLRKKGKKYDEIADKLDSDGCNVSACVASIFGGIAVIICILVLLISNSPRIIKQNVDKTTMERESLIYRLETHDTVGNECLYNDVVEFNKKVYDYNYYHNSIWTSWFNPEEYTKIEPIDYQKIIETQNSKCRGE